MVKESHSSSKTPKVNQTTKQHKLDQELQVTESNQMAASNVDSLTYNIDKSHHFIKNIYKEIADNIFDGLLCIDPKLVILFANRTIHKMAGMESPQLIGRSILEFIPIDQRPILFEQINLRNQGIDSSYQLNLEVLGEKRRVDIRAKSMFDRRGKYDYSIVILTDITERVQLKSRLDESENKLTHIFENINEGFIIINETNQVIMANHAAARIFGLQTGTIEGMNLYEIIDKSRMKIMTFEHSSYKSSGNNKYEIELTLPNGIVKHILFSVSSQYNSQGVYTGAYGVVSDITESIIAKQQLLDKDRMFNRAQQIARIGYLEYDVLTNIVQGSSQIYSLYELDLSEKLPTLEEHIKNYIHQDDLSKFKDYVKNIYSDSSSVYTEHRLITKKGNVRYIKSVIEPEVNAQGKVVKLFATVTDETELQIAKLSSVEFEDRFYKIFQHAPDAIAITNIKTSEVIAANKNIQQLFGFKPEEVVGKFIKELNIWKSIDHRQKFMDAFEKSKHIYNFATSLYTKQGTEINVIISAEYLEIDGNPCGMFIIHNISELIEAQKALLKSEEKFRTLIERMSEGIIITDASDKIVYCNDQVCIGLKSTIRELINKPIIELNVLEEDKDSFREHLLKVKKGFVNKIELQMFNPNGEQLFFIITSQPMMKNGEYSGAISIISNITELKLIQLEQIETIEKLQTTLEEVKTLSGLLPICSYCKKIRNDEGYWLQLEEYLSKHSDAKFTHSICNDCLKKMP